MPLTQSLSPSDGERVADRPGEGSSALQLIHADALKYLETTPRDWRGWKLVSNLPYSVASPLLVELALAEHGPERMVVTLQLEVAKRLGQEKGPDATIIVNLSGRGDKDMGTAIEWFGLGDAEEGPDADLEQVEQEAAK